MKDVIDSIIDDLIEIKIKELTKFKYDAEYTKNGFDRTHQIIKSIEKEIADLNFNEEQRVLYLSRLMNEIVTKDLILYHQSINEYIPVDVTSDVLKWADRYLLAWELKQTLKLDNQEENNEIPILNNENKPEETRLENPHPEIFKSLEAYHIFDEFLKDGNPENYLRDCSFIYRMMCEQEKPSLIHEHIKPGAFRVWINSNRTDVDGGINSQLKTFEHSTDRENRYNRIKTNIFKQHSTF